MEQSTPTFSLWGMPKYNPTFTQVSKGEGLLPYEEGKGNQTKPFSVKELVFGRALAL